MADLVKESTANVHSSNEDPNSNATPVDTPGASTPATPGPVDVQDPNSKSAGEYSSA